MSQRILTVDLGNTRCKLCVFEHARDGALRTVDETSFATAQALDVGPRLAREVIQFAARQPDLSIAALSCVGPLALEDEVSAALSELLGARFQRNPDSGLAVECSPPAGVGRDRLYAARGAYQLVRSAAIVVDAGTALTVDAVASGDARPRFLGGAIAPGPRLLADALARHAARLPLVDPRPGAHALGRDTEGALQAGIVVGFRGAAAELARRVARASGLEGAPVVICGGARAFLLEPTSCFEAPTIESARLVHLGLAWAAIDLRGGAL